MNAKHTPGPWFISPLSPRFIKANGIGNTVAEVADWSNMEANSLLIATAPELLEALKSHPFTEHLGDERGPCPCRQCKFIHNAERLIAKAEGTP